MGGAQEDLSVVGLVEALRCGISTLKTAWCVSIVIFYSNSCKVRIRKSNLFHWTTAPLAVMIFTVIIPELRNTTSGLALESGLGPRL